MGQMCFLSSSVDRGVCFVHAADGNVEIVCGDASVVGEFHSTDGLTRSPRMTEDPIQYA